MAKGLFNVMSWRNFGIGLLLTFIGFQLVSYILNVWFPSPFNEVIKAYSLVWTWILFIMIILLVGYFILKIKDFDKKSLFVGLLALAILSFIVIYFKIDFGKLFDMSIAQNQFGSIVKTIGSIITP